jgi:hypothetical protein
MAISEIKEFLKIVPAVRKAPFKYLWSSYDPEADVLYINFKKPSHATDSEITDDDIVVAIRKRRCRWLNCPACQQTLTPRGEVHHQHHTRLTMHQ